MDQADKYAHAALFCRVGLCRTVSRSVVKGCPEGIQRGMREGGGRVKAQGNSKLVMPAVETIRPPGKKNKGLQYNLLCAGSFTGRQYSSNLGVALCPEVVMRSRTWRA